MLKKTHEGACATASRQIFVLDELVCGIVWQLRQVYHVHKQHASKQGCENCSDLAVIVMSRLILLCLFELH